MIIAVAGLPGSAGFSRPTACISSVPSGIEGSAHPVMARYRRRKRSVLASPSLRIRKVNNDLTR